MDAGMWNDMFALALPVLEKILRTAFVYFALVVGLRLAGKRELAQLNPFDLVVLLTLSNTVQNAIIGPDDSVTGGLIGAATLLALNYLVVRFIYKNARIERIVEGEEDVLVRSGQVINEALAREAITLDELKIAAHRQGFGSLEEVEKAVLEPSGGISFIGHTPSPGAVRHQELLDSFGMLRARLDALTREVADLRDALAHR